MRELAYPVTELAGRLKALLPKFWFGDSTPVLDSLLTGLGTGWFCLLQYLSYVRLQGRIATATTYWLDLIAQDLMGSAVVRRLGETDRAFRRRVSYLALRAKGTRQSLEEYLSFLTGSMPTLIEPSRPADLGGYGGLQGNAPTVMGYNSSGRWGSDALPFQIFVVVRLPHDESNGLISGWTDADAGYGSGNIAFGTGGANPALPDAAEIYRGIAATIPAGAIAWVAMTP